MIDPKKLFEKIRTKANVEGCSLKLMPRITNGKVVPDTKVFRVYVTKKVTRAELKRSDIVPKKIKGVETDIVEIGKIRAFSTDRTQRIRPVPLAVSVANWNITAGSLGMHYRSPAGGPVIYAGSNAHVLCDSPDLPPEEIEEKRICQPGPYHDDNKQDNIVGEYTWHEQVKPVTSSECPLSKLVLWLLNKAAAVFGRNTRFYSTAIVTNHQDFAVYFPSESEQHVLEIPDASLEGKKFIGHLFGGCYDKKTRVFTSEGLKFFEDLTGKEQILTLDPQTHKIEWQIPTQIHKYPFKGELIHFSVRNVDLLVTPNHRMYVSKENKAFTFISAQEILETIQKSIKEREINKELFLKAKDLHQDVLNKDKRSTGQYHVGPARISKILGVSITTISHWLYELNGEVITNNLKNLTKFEFLRTGEWKGTTIKQINLPSVNGINAINISNIPINIWLKFLGWYLSEGCVIITNDRRYRIQIANHSEKNRKEIAKLVKQIGFSPYDSGQAISFISKQLGLYLKNFGKSGDKYIPKEIKELPKSKLKILINTMMEGDGTKKDFAYNTSSWKLAQDFAEISLKSGYTITISKEEQNIHMNKKGVLIKPNTPFRYIIYLGKHYKTPRLKQKPEMVDYNDFVYCVSVPNHIMMVERNGKLVWCGNSDTVGVIGKVKYAIENGFDPVIEPANVNIGDTVWGASFWGDYETVVEDTSAMIQVSYGDFVAVFEDVVLVKNEKVVKGGWSGSGWYKISV